MQPLQERPCQTQASEVLDIFNTHVGHTAGRDKIELLLALGATRWEASRETIARCVRLALTPILNQMNVVVSYCRQSADRQFSDQDGF